MEETKMMRTTTEQMNPKRKVKRHLRKSVKNFLIALSFITILILGMSIVNEKAKENERWTNQPSYSYQPIY